MSLSLPIDSIRHDLESCWANHRNFILKAPTGSGKSTRVPRFLYEWDGFDENLSILILQPRRMAARLLARRVAAELDQPIGQTVGYQVRFDAKRSAKTRLLFVTEGLLMRMLMLGDGLRGIGGILFDEFHERHLEGDVGLGLAIQEQERGWPGKIGVLSATLDTGELASYLPEATVLESEGRQYPVEAMHCGTMDGKPVWKQAAKGLKQAIRNGAEGDILVFMPGKYEINRTLEEFRNMPETRGWDLYPLHGELDAASQDSAVTEGDRPRIIVSTNIAETSLTLPGIRTVIDSGLARLPDFDPRRGVNSLLTEKISRASAEQRAGRAGRMAPGLCFRLWTLKEHEHRPARIPPEIERLDLTELKLQLTAMGKHHDFPWLTPPPEASWEKAGRLLEELGATHEGKATDLGRQMVRYPLHPRISRILMEARKRGCVDLITLAIALGEGRKVLLPLKDKRKSEEREDWWREAMGVSDLLRDVLIWQKVTDMGGSMAFCKEWGIHRQALNQAEQVFRQIKGILGDVPEDREANVADFAKCLLSGYVDQVAVRTDRGTRHCRMVHGRRGELRRDSIIQGELFVATDIEEREFRGEMTLFLGDATLIEESWLEEMYPDDIKTQTVQRMDLSRRRVESVRQTKFRDLILREKQEGNPDPATASRFLAKAIHEEGWVLKKWNQSAENWIRRLNVLVQYCPELEIQPIREEDRLILIEQICEGAVSYKEVKDRPVQEVLESWVPDNLLPLMDEWVPTRFDLPSGARPKLRYEKDGTVVLPARIQQLYDVSGKLLRICQRKCPLRLEILAPNGRCVQITNDLDGFWIVQYPQIRKELFGRYPKHEWR